MIKKTIPASFLLMIGSIAGAQNKDYPIFENWYKKFPRKFLFSVPATTRDCYRANGLNRN
jgi:hypothetical protein